MVAACSANFNLNTLIFPAVFLLFLPWANVMLSIDRAPKDSDISSSSSPSSSSSTSSLLDNEILIPGLPNHLSVHCLLKVPRLYHLSLRGVSSLWRKVLRASSFYENRRRFGLTDPWLVVLSVETVSKTGPLLYATYDLQSEQLLFQVKFPPFRCLNLLSDRALDQFRLAAVDEYFLLLGCGTSEEDHFIIYNTVTNEWRNGAAIGVARYLFACGVIDGNLYVAGGFNSCGKLERSMEVYNFKANKWKEAARMPDEAGHTDADFVFQRKLYVRCSDPGSNRNMRTMLWEYDPEHDEWRQEARLSSNMPKEGNLVATDSFMYVLSVDHGEFHRFETSSGEWKFDCVPPSDTAAQRNIFNERSQRAFGYGDREICFLSGGNGYRQPCSSAGVRHCHRLFLGSSWYCAGAIVRA